MQRNKKEKKSAKKQDNNKGQKKDKKKEEIKDEKKEEDYSVPPKVHFSRFDVPVYIIATPLEKARHKFTMQDLIFYLSFELKFEYWLPLKEDEEVGFFAIEVRKGEFDFMLKRKKNIVEYANHRLEFTSKYPVEYLQKEHKKLAVGKTRYPSTVRTTTPTRPPASTSGPDRLTTMLPTELHVRILQYCNVEDVCNVALCSSYWKSVADCNAVWKPLCLRLFPDGPRKYLTEEEEKVLFIQKKIERESMPEWQQWAESAKEEEEEEKKSDKKEIVSWKQECATLLAQSKIERQRVVDLHQVRMHHRYWMMCGVHMFHPVNGRCGFDALPPPEFPPGQTKPPLETIKAMLKREDELRLSAPVQARFADPAFDAIRIAEQVQEQVVSEFFGLDAPPEIRQLGLDIIRAAPALYPENPEIRRIPHYLKYNRSRRGELEAGDLIPDAYLARLSGAPVTLFETLSSLTCGSKLDNSNEAPSTVVIACGSYT
jgi:hypothetical protein